jgi:hypothetical protein
MGLINQQVLNTGSVFTQAIFHYDFNRKLQSGYGIVKFSINSIFQSDSKIVFNFFLLRIMREKIFNFSISKMCNYSERKFFLNNIMTPNLVIVYTNV